MPVLSCCWLQMPILHLGRAIKNAILTFSAGFFPMLLYGYFEDRCTRKLCMLVFLLGAGQNMSLNALGRRWVSGGPCATVRTEWGLPSPPWGASSASGWWWGLGCPSGHGHVVTSRCFGRHGHVLGGPLPPGLVTLPHCSEMHGWASGGVGTPYTHTQCC